VPCPPRSKSRRRATHKGKGKCIYIAFIFVVHGSHSFTCNYTNVCLYLISVHQMAPPRLRLRTSNCSLLLIYLPGKDERLSRPGWLTCSERFTHISGHPSAVGRTQDRKTSPVKDQCSTTAPRNQPHNHNEITELKIKQYNNTTVF